MAILEAPDSVTAAGETAADTGGDAAAVVGTTAAAEPAAAGQPEGNGGASPAVDESQTVEIEYPEEGDDEAEPEAEPTPEPQTDVPEAEAALGSSRYGTQALTRMLKEHPELETAAAADPRVKAQLYQMARRSQELAQYQDVAPSLTMAREAAQAHEALANYDQAYYGNDPEQFWRGLYEASQVRDPATGQTRSSGAYERNAQFLQQVFLDGLEDQARQNGNEGLGDAVSAIRETLGWGNSRTTPASQAKDGTRQRSGGEDLPPHIRQQLQELEQLRSRRSQEAEQATERFLDETANDAGRELRGFVDGILAQAKMSDYDKANIARDFMEQVAKLADQDKVHNAALEEIMRQRGTTPEARAQMVARVKAWARQNGREILEPILRQAGAGLRQRQQQREQARASVRSEPRTTGAPAPVAQPSGLDLVRQAEAKAKRRLTDREILDLA